MYKQDILSPILPSISSKTTDPNFKPVPNDPDSLKRFLWKVYKIFQEEGERTISAWHPYYREMLNLGTTQDFIKWFTHVRYTDTHTFVLTTYTEFETHLTDLYLRDKVDTKAKLPPDYNNPDALGWMTIWYWSLIKEYVFDNFYSNYDPGDAKQIKAYFDYGVEGLQQICAYKMLSELQEYSKWQIQRAWMDTLVHEDYKF